MKQSTKAIRAVSVSLVMAMGLTGPGWADSADMDVGPSLEEYLAAKTIVRAYMARQSQTQTDATLTDPKGASVEMNVAAADAEKTDSVTRAVTNAGFSVFGSGNTEAATVTAISADGNDGLLMVGSPDAFNEVLSGRLVFQEDTSFYNGNYPDGLCGFQFRLQGDTSTLTMERGCTGVSPLVTYPRNTNPIIFHNDIVIGGTPFDGGGSGGTTGGGFLMMSFHANGTLSCNNVCSNHQMSCDHTMYYGNSLVNSCSDVPSGDFTWVACACSN